MHNKYTFAYLKQHNNEVTVSVSTQCVLLHQTLDYMTDLVELFERGLIWLWRVDNDIHCSLASQGGAQSN